MTRIAFRADASEDIGTGHVMRCLALATELRNRGAECVFVCRDLPGHRAGQIRQQDFAVELLPLTGDYRRPAGDTDYRRWAQVEELTDAAEFVARVVHADAVVVDHYGFAAEWETAVTAALGCRMVAVDDLCRVHQVHHLVDQNFGRTAASYAQTARQAPQTDIMAGPAFALLRAEFRAQRARLHRPAAEPAAHRLLVTLGGIDQHNVTGAVVAALQAILPDWLTETVVLLPEGAPHHARVRERLNSITGFRLLGSADRMAGLMAEATLCIGAVGGTAWERMALGLPSVLVPVAQNQQPAAERLAAAELAVLLPAADIETRLAECLDAVRSRWPELAQRNLEVCDAAGTLRVAERLLAAAGPG